MVLLASPNVASKRAVYRRYDHEVQTRTMVKPGAGDAAVLRLREIPKALALAVDGNGRTAWLDPYTGGAMAVAEACRNVAVSGATPLAITDCLNFGNPQKSEVYYQLEECVRGMADACSALGVPVVSGNVSLYNETQGEAVYPTPVVGAVGLLDDVHGTRSVRRSPARAMPCSCSARRRRTMAALAGSEYLAARTRDGGWQALPSTSTPKPACSASSSTLRVSRLAAFRPRLLGRRPRRRAGGERCPRKLSASPEWAGWPDGRWDAALFGETASRAVVSCAEANVPPTSRLSAREAGVPCASAWVSLEERPFLIPGPVIAFPGLVDESLADLADAFFGGLGARPETPSTSTSGKTQAVPERPKFDATPLSGVATPSCATIRAA